MAQLTTSTLSIDQIEIEEEFNVRKEMDKAKLGRMAGSIQQRELVQPISVCKGEAGKYVLVDGHPPVRRCKLAREQEAGLVSCCRDRNDQNDLM